VLDRAMTKRILNCPCVVLRIGQRVAAGVEVVGQVSPRYPPRLIARPFCRWHDYKVY
jgi:hypothetical protein